MPLIAQLLSLKLYCYCKYFLMHSQEASNGFGKHDTMYHKNSHGFIWIIWIYMDYMDYMDYMECIQKRFA